MKTFLEQVNKTNSCWLWTGSITKGGYGQKQHQGKVQYVHRISYQLYKGVIPDGLQIDHLCRNRACVNPDHLEPVTNRENVLRGIGLAAINARKTHCINGHILSKSNLLKSELSRKCKVCWSNYRKKRSRKVSVGCYL